jgi:hypothetical protein
MSPCTTCPPVAGDQYTRPPENWPTRPSAPGVSATSAVGKPSGPVMPPRAHHAVRTAPYTAWVPVAADE